MQTSPKPIALEYSNDQTSPLPPDEHMMGEIIQILKKYQALNRFGLMRIDDDTKLPTHLVMTESCDPINRQLISKPESRKPLTVATVETQWSFNQPGMLKACTGKCIPRPEGHGTQHQQTTEIERS